MLGTECSLLFRSLLKVKVKLKFKFKMIKLILKVIEITGVVIIIGVIEWRFPELALLIKRVVFGLHYVRQVITVINDTYNWLLLGV